MKKKPAEPLFIANDEIISKKTAVEGKLVFGAPGSGKTTPPKKRKKK